MKFIEPVKISDSSNFSRASTATYIDSDGVMKTAPVDFQRLNYLSNQAPIIEASATNLLLYSNMLSAPQWAVIRGNYIANATTAPTGSATAYKFLEDTTPSVHGVRISAIGFSVGVKYALSIYAKAAERTSLTLKFGGITVGLVSAEFNLAAKTATAATGCTATIEEFINGWFRLSVTGIATATATDSLYITFYSTTPAYLGDGVSGMYLWGAQLEAGGLSSYIPTTTVAVTRAADIPVRTYSNVLEPYGTEVAWDSSTSYAVGSHCILAGTHKIYECVTANSGSSPDVNLTGLTPKWAVFGPTNRWLMFDDAWGTQTINRYSLVCSFTPGAGIDTVALLNISASSVTVTISRPELGAVYTLTASTVSKSDYIFLDLPKYSDATVSITAISSGTVAIGKVVIGNAVFIGDTQYGAKAGITDYSTKTVDVFGSTTIVKRKYAKRMTVNLMTSNAIIDSVFNKLAMYRATPLVWIGSDNLFSILIDYGYYQSFEVDISYALVCVV